MARSFRIWATAAAALSLAACTHHVDAAYFGKHVQPPHGLAALRPGMTMKEAHAAVPGLDKDGHLSSGVKDLELSVDEERGRIEDIIAIHHGGFDKLLTAAWGPPVKEAHQRDVDAAWEDATTGWRAELSGSVLSFYRLMTPAYFGTAGHPFGVFAKLAPTATYAEARARARGMIDDVTAGHDGVGVNPRDTSQKALGEIVVMGLSAREKDVLLAAWGPGLAVHGQGEFAGYVAAWLAPDGWRAFLKQHDDRYDVELSPYLTDAELFGDGPGLAVLPRPVIGRTIEELRGAYAVHDFGDGTSALEIPPDAWAPLDDSVLFFSDGGKVSRATISLRYDLHPERAAELKALFAKKWGAPKPDASLRDLAKSGDPPLVYPATAEFVPVVEDLGNGTLYLELRAPAAAPAKRVPAKK